ncbi:MAG: carboxypeptidase-like regulatory domain-containing protein, partial [Dysgonamonadaceae bacterium]|nr:carboxypeptidase-like regulatory domain-containing protein [Dysgonamonadaceae bacterium]
MKIKNIIILLALSLFPLLSMAQKQTFSMGGVVYDEFGETLPGASIFLKNTPSMGTATDANGAFKISASRGDVIVVTYIGYDNFEYLVEKEDANIKVNLTPSANQLEEVVATALGNQRKISVVGAITAVNVNEIQTPATS